MPLASGKWLVRTLALIGLVAVFWGAHLLLAQPRQQATQEIVAPTFEVPDQSMNPGTDEDKVHEPTPRNPEPYEEPEIPEDSAVDDKVGSLETATRPVHIAIPAKDIAAEIDTTGPSYNSNRFNPAAGRIDFWLEPGTAKPCEAGPSFMLGHVTDVFAYLTTGPGDDHRDGLETGDKVAVTLEDGTECIFEVVDFDLAIGEPVDGTPAHRIGKNDWAQTYWEEAIQSSIERPVLFLLTSSGTEFEPSGHRANNDIVMAELTDIRTPAG